MGMLIGIVLLLSLGWTEFCAPAEVNSWATLLFNVFLLATVSPAFAAIQIRAAIHRHSKDESSDWGARFRTMAYAHMIVWTIASVAIIFSGWPAALVSFGNIEAIPLVTDLLAVGPALSSLIASWAIFIFFMPRNSLSTRQPRISLFVLWLRMQVAFVAVPILFAFFIADCVRLVSLIDVSAIGQSAIWCALVLIIFAVILFYPQLMLRIWSTRPLNDDRLKSRFDSLIHRAGLRPRSIRVWQTGDSVINAAAVGIVPGTEVVIVSDLLLNMFDDDEVDAIVLHELGHIYHRHTIKRIAMVIVPLVILAIDQASGMGIHALLTQSDLLNSTFGSVTALLPAIGFLIYLFLISKTVFCNMELEADQYAIESLNHSGASGAVESALEKMAVIYPRQIDKRSGLHPSLRQRLAFAIETRAGILKDHEEPISPVPAPKGISLDPITAK